MDLLSDRFRIIAPDLYGHGGTPAWDGHRGMRVDDEVDLVESAFLMAGDRFHLIGHSWGGAIALKAALRHRDEIMSLTLYEPALWSLLVSGDPTGAGAREIETNRRETQRLMDEGDFSDAARYFLDYWVGKGTWDLLPEVRKSAFAAGMHAAGPEWHASFHETAPLDAFAAIHAPTLLLTGTRSTAPGRAMTGLLAPVIPNARVVELEGIGHMGPVTHPDMVNRAVEAFLMEVQEKDGTSP